MTTQACCQSRGKALPAGKGVPPPAPKAKSPPLWGAFCFWRRCRHEPNALHWVLRRRKGSKSLWARWSPHPKLKAPFGHGGKNRSPKGFCLVYPPPAGKNQNQCRYEKKGLPCGGLFAFDGGAVLSEISIHNL